MDKLVRVVDLSHSSRRDKEVAREHGYLWLREDAIRPIYSERDDTLRMYRSLATGHVYRWWDSEIEEAGDA